MILVSCCNDNGGVFSIDEETLQVERVHDEESRGMAVDGDFFYVATHHALRLYWKKELIAQHIVKYNWHGLTIKNGIVYAVDARRDQIQCFDRLLNPIEPPTVELFGSRGRVNDVYVFNGEFYYCCFQKKAPGTGAVFRLPSPEPVIHGLHDPHTPIVTEDHIYITNSAAGEVRRYSNGHFDVILKVREYTRGLYFDDQYMWAGLSKRRRADDQAWRCGVIRQDISGVQDFIELPANEVYAIVKKD